MTDAFDYRERMTAIQDRIVDEERRRWPESPVLVNISSLPPARKRAVWEHLQAQQPAIAAVMQEPAVREMRELFGAAVCLPRDIVKEVLNGQ
ncbi:MAG: hypothetical protein KDC18_19360 [Alphaproteobacteria bacterium]|nr:hypothetical protein [Alphaproteobacteria bacterium]